jgi:hypothetical protein
VAVLVPVLAVKQLTLNLLVVVLLTDFHTHMRLSIEMSSQFQSKVEVSMTHGKIQVDQCLYYQEVY